MERIIRDEVIRGWKNIFYKITARTMGLNRTRTIVTILGVILSAAMLTAVAVFGHQRPELY